MTYVMITVSTPLVIRTSEFLISTEVRFMNVMKIETYYSYIHDPEITAYVLL